MTNLTLEELHAKETTFIQLTHELLDLYNKLDLEHQELIAQFMHKIAWTFTEILTTTQHKASPYQRKGTGLPMNHLKKEHSR